MPGSHGVNGKLPGGKLRVHKARCLIHHNRADHNAGAADLQKGTESLKGKDYPIGLSRIPMPQAAAFSCSRRLDPVRAVFLFLAATLLLAACAKPTAPPPAVSTSTSRVDGAPQRRSVLGFGDEVDVAVWREDDLTTSAKIDASGHIHMPLVGEVQAGGRTPAELRAELTKAFAKYVVDPQVTVKTTTLRSQNAIILGEIKSPGVVSLDHDMTLFEGIARAGGFTDDAGRNMVVLLRPEAEKPRAYILDMRLGTTLGKGVVGFDRYLESGDILYVPKSTWATVEEFMSHMNTVLDTVVNAERFVIFLPQLRDAVKDLTRGPTTTTTVVQQTSSSTTSSQPVAGEVLSNSQGGVTVAQ